LSSGVDGRYGRAMDSHAPRGLVSLLNMRIGRSVVLKGPLIAIVDDDESMRDTTRDLLESAGFSAATFASAARLLKSRRLHRVSCLIADMRMPNMTGLELLQHLTALNLAIPTIVMTAYPDERVRAQAMKANIVCYLTKPFEADELLNCVRRAIHKS
jgi:FixJ family two-component response regulator